MLNGRKEKIKQRECDSIIDILPNMSMTVPNSRQKHYLVEECIVKSSVKSNSKMIIENKCAFLMFIRIKIITDNDNMN